MQNDRPLVERVLSLVCPYGVGFQADFASITEAEWCQVMQWAREHRIAPLIYYSARTAGVLLQLPGRVKDELSSLYRNATLHALIVQRDLIRVNAALTSAGIRHLFLKGAFLAPFAYPELGLRPMRDIDVIVPQPEALAAYNCLRRVGFQPYNSLGSQPEVFLRDTKHLPALHAPDGGTYVEVHVTLISPGQGGFTATMPDFSQLSARSVSRVVAGEVISFPSAEDMLLHLCVHAVYDHQLNNGPLALYDLHYLIRSQSIDWPLVWNDARACQSEPGVRLMLTLAAEYFGGSAVKWPEGALPPEGVDPEIVACASALLFRDFDTRSYIGTVEKIGRSKTLSGAVCEVARRMLPSHTEMARKFPATPGSLLIFFCYPVLWMMLLLRSLPQSLVTLCNRDRRIELRNLRRLNVWLLDKAKRP